MTPEGENAGSVGDVGPIGNEWSFTLLDHQKREIVAFVFAIEGDARRAAKAMQTIVGEASALARCALNGNNVPD